MGWPSVVFVADANLLRSLLPGWQPALSAAITRTEVNPFTNEPMTFVQDIVVTSAAVDLARH